MLVKKLELRRIYENGFNDEYSPRSTEIYDLDRDISILKGNEVADRILIMLDGITLGLEMAGYSVDVERVIEIDGTNGNTRISVLNK